MIRVLIDARWLRRGKRGIGNFTESLLEGLSKLSNPQIDITVAIPQSNAVHLTEKFSDSFKFILIPNLPDPITDVFYFSYINIKYRFDLIHFTGNSGLLLIHRNCRVLLTLHDVSFMKDRSIVPWPQRTKQIIGRIYRMHLIPMFVKNAQKVVTVSNFALNDILKEFPFIKDIEYLYHGFNNISENPTSTNIEITTLVNNSLLVIGGNDPQKNLITVVLAFIYLYEKLGKNAPRVCIIGLSINDFKEFNPGIQLTPNVQFLGYLGNDQISHVIKNSKGIIIASYYESFGLPVIESLFMGKSVICSDRGALPEIGGNAPIYFDPGSIESLINAIEFFNLNPERTDEIKKWRELAENRFSWNKTASRYAEIYLELGVRS